MSERVREDDEGENEDRAQGLYTRLRNMQVRSLKRKYHAVRAATVDNCGTLKGPSIPVNPRKIHRANAGKVGNMFTARFGYSVASFSYLIVCILVADDGTHGRELRN